MIESMPRQCGPKIINVFKEKRFYGKCFGYLLKKLYLSRPNDSTTIFTLNL